MSQVVIENPIINAPFDEPSRHFRFSDEGITDEIIDGRRTSSYFVPIARPKKKRSTQLQFRHGMDAGSHRRKQARQRYPSSRHIVAQGRLRWRDADYRTFDGLLDRSQPRKKTILLPDRSLETASILPKWQRNTAIHG